MTSGVITLTHWGQFEERTREAWRELVRMHGFDPDDVGFPLVIDGGTMIVREYLRNEAGARYLKNREIAVRDVEVKLQTEVGLPRICRT